jgi:hypothetical protein
MIKISDFELEKPFSVTDKAEQCNNIVEIFTTRRYWKYLDSQSKLNLLNKLDRYIKIYIEIKQAKNPQSFKKKLVSWFN